jgi:hypothetical protein
MTEEPAIIPSAAGTEPEWLAVVRDKVRGLEYGVVQLVVHGGRVIQIERTEKTRLASERKPASRE